MEELRIALDFWQAMLDHVRAVLPEEACGMAAGRGEVIQKLFLITNELHSPVRFQMDPREQLDALLWIEEHELDLTVIFHSHPAGPPVPSETDIAEFAYPGTVTLIWSPAETSSGWQARGFIIEDKTYREIPVRWEERPN